MPHREPTIRSRELGEGLRQAMQHAGLTGKQAAQALDVSPSFVSMLLSGKRATSEADIAAFLGVCRVKGPERDRLLALRREQDTPGWFQQHGSRLPQQLITLIDHENKAVTISDFQPMVVPGLLQTAEYARALIQETVNVPPGEVDGRVAARLARQSLFSRDRPAAFTYYLHEFALRLPVGGPVVMAEQLEHLRRMSTRSYLTLRVLPAARGGHAGIAGAGPAPRGGRPRRDRRGVQADGVRRVQAGDLPRQRDRLPVPGAARGNCRLPAHPGRTGENCTG